MAILISNNQELTTERTCGDCKRTFLDLWSYAIGLLNRGEYKPLCIECDDSSLEVGPTLTQAGLDAINGD